MSHDILALVGMISPDLQSVSQTRRRPTRRVPLFQGQAFAANQRAPLKTPMLTPRLNYIERNPPALFHLLQTRKCFLSAKPRQLRKNCNGIIV